MYSLFHNKCTTTNRFTVSGHSVQDVLLQVWSDVALWNAMLQQFVGGEVGVVRWRVVAVLAVYVYPQRLCWTEVPRQV